MNGFENVRIGDSIFVQSYKHNGSLHRTWSKALVIDVLENCLVVVTDHTWVVESDGRRWLTKEPAICFYYDDRWYNVISMIRKRWYSNDLSILETLMECVLEVEKQDA